MAGAFSDGRSGIAHTADLAAQELRKAEKLERRERIALLLPVDAPRCRPF